MRQLRFGFIILILSMVLVSNSFAVDSQNHDFYTAFDATSTSYVYTEAGGTANTSGIWAVDRFQAITVTALVTTLNSTSVTIRIEGGIISTESGSIVWSSIYSKTYTGATAYPEDIPCYGTWDFLRVGLIIVADVAADSISVYAKGIDYQNRR